MKISKKSYTSDRHELLEFSFTNKTALLLALISGFLSRTYFLLRVCELMTGITLADYVEYSLGKSIAIRSHGRSSVAIFVYCIISQM